MDIFFWVLSFYFILIEISGEQVEKLRENIERERNPCEKKNQKHQRNYEMLRIQHH